MQRIRSGRLEYYMRYGEWRKSSRKDPCFADFTTSPDLPDRLALLPQPVDRSRPEAAILRLASRVSTKPRFLVIICRRPMESSQAWVAVRPLFGRARRSEPVAEAPPSPIVVAVAGEKNPVIPPLVLGGGMAPKASGGGATAIPAESCRPSPSSAGHADGASGPPVLHGR